MSARVRECVCEERGREGERDRDRDRDRGRERGGKQTKKIQTAEAVNVTF